MVGPWTPHGRAGRSRVRRPGRLRSLGSEDGFTLVEIVIGTGVMLTALVMLAGVMTSGLTATAVARERQSANGLANQTLEEIRALPYETLARGLDTTDVSTTAGTTDPDVTSCSGAYCFQDERVVHATNAPTDPLVPHVKSVSVGATPFQVAAYVTYYQNQLTANAFRVTVHVSWTSNVRNGSAQTVEAQTIVYSPKACLSLAVHPYSGPCQPSLTATASTDASTITAQGTVGGVSLAQAILSSGRASSDMTIEQTSRVEGLAQGIGAVLQALGGGEQAIGRNAVSSQAANDPGASDPAWQSQSLSSQAAASAMLSSSTGAVAADLTAGGSGLSTSTTSANPSAGRPCPNLSGVADETDSQPCGGSRTTTGSTATLGTSLNVGTLSVASFPVAVLGPQANPTTAITDRAVPSGDGTALATLTRSAIDFKVGGLPTVLKPVTGFDYFVKLTGYNDAATAQAGASSVAPTAATNATLTYWTKTTNCILLVCTDNYSTVNVPLSSITAATTIPGLQISLPALNTSVTFSATVTPEARSITSSCVGTCTRTDALSKVTPVTVTVTMKVTVAGTTALDLTFTADPGTMQAKATYAAAPAS